MARTTAAQPATFTYKVQGHGDFPLDMLRYDRCWPKSEWDSNAIRKSLAPRSQNEGWEIEVTGLREPTVGRWESFGWKAV